MKLPSAVLSIVGTVLVALPLAAQDTPTPAQKSDNAVAPVEEVRIFIEVHRLPPFQLSLSSDVPAPPTLREDAFLNTQEYVLGSSRLLERVIDRLDLLSKFEGVDKEELVRRMQRQMSAIRMEGSAVFRVTATAATGKEARVLATEVVRAYKELRESNYRQIANGQLDALEAEIRAQEDIVEEKRKLYHTICKAMGFVIPAQFSAELANEQLLRRMERIRIEKGDFDALDFGLRTEDFKEALSDLQLARKILLDMREQYSRARIARNIPLHPITILGER